jgi:sugar O-acyltransferase (sialic acid O-acetyltransferase NeuD family)
LSDHLKLIKGKIVAKLVIFGAGDIARLADYYFSRDSDHTVEAFTVDREYLTAESFLEKPLVPFETVAQHYPPEHYKFFVALSYAQMNKLRAKKFQQAKELGYECVSYVSSHCRWLSDHPAGENCFILEDNTIQPFVKIGHNVTLWSGNHIGHDSVIDDHCFITSHVVVSGRVHVQESCFIGVNATLRNSIKIAPFTLIGGGTVIMDDTVEKGVYVPPKAILLRKSSDSIEL